VTAKEFFEAFSRETITAFYEKAIALSDTLNARLARLRNIRNLVFIRAGDLISGTLVFGLERITQAAVRMREAFAPVGIVIDRTVKSFQDSFRSLNFEAVFERIAQIIRGSSSLVREFGDRLARIGILFNGAALIAVFVAVRSVLTAINTLMGQFLDKLQRFSGIDLSTPERAFAAIAAALDVLPLIMASATRIWIHFKQVARETFGEMFTNIRGLIKLWALAEAFKNPAKAFGITILLKQVDEVVDKLRQPAEDGSFSDTIAKEIDGMLKKIAKAQANLRAVLEGEDGKGKTQAAEGINQAAENLRSALKGDPADILSLEEFGRRLNSATFSASITPPEVEQKKQAEDTAATARNTAEIASLIRRSTQSTPLFGRLPGIV
jgi:hypothetical protein